MARKPQALRHQPLAATDAPALEPPHNPKDVKDITPQVTRLIDAHPMTAQLAVLKRLTPKPEV